MAIAFKSSCFLQFNKPDTSFWLSFSSRKPVIISVKRYTSVAAIKTMETVGISETFNRLKKQGKVSSYIYSIFYADSNQSFSLCMFSSVVRKIDFEWIDSIKLIMTKSELKVKWFVFGYIRVKVSWTINLCVKINSIIKSYKS